MPDIGLASARPAVTLGIYEKALPWPGSWDAFFGQAANAGFSFVDLSIDESPGRMARLRWTAHERLEVRDAAARAGVMIGGICLSAHRAVAPGSTDAATRTLARQMLLEAIDLCVDLGAPLVQVAGYFAYYETHDESARSRYLEVIAAGADHAARRGVMLGIENVDGDDITSIRSALGICEDLGSAYLQLYPDIGNLTEQGLDVVTELAAGRGRMLALHVKDTRPGEPRHVPMGGGDVPWEAAFGELARQGWSGRVLIEMWNEARSDAVRVSQRAREFIQARLADAGIAVAGAAHAALESTQHRGD